MFYKTKIQSINGGSIIDAQGRRLAFIGYLPVKVGDTVFTDGKYIFGNVPPKGSTVVFDEPSGIPVLGDSDSSDNELRGYFTTQGRFKNYKIAQDDWMTNSKKSFAHGQKELAGEKVIDANVAEDGKELIVTDGFYRKCQYVKYHNHLYYVIMRYMYEVESDEIVFSADTHPFIDSIKPIEGQEVTLGADAADINKPVSIYKDGKKITEISLESFAQKAEEECWNCYSELANESTDITEYINWECSQMEPTNFIKQPAPPSGPFIALKYSRVESFKVDEDGNWDAIISSAAYGHCFFYITLPGSLFYTLFKDESLKDFSRALVDMLDGLEKQIFDENKYPFLSINKYRKFEGKKKDSDGNYTEEYETYTLAKLEYYIPLVRFKHTKWEPFYFSSNFLFHVHNGEIVTTIIGASGGGNSCQITEGWDEETSYGESIFTISTPERTYPDDDYNYTLSEKNEWDFPLDAEYTLHGEGYDLLGIRLDEKTVFNISEDIRNSISNIRVLPSYPMPFEFLYDEKALEMAGTTPENPYQSDELFNIQHRWITQFIYRPNNEDIDSYLNDEDKEIYYPLWMHLSEDKEDSDDGFFRFNPVFLLLKNGEAFFGFHDGKLYHKTKTGEEVIGDGLKNFRLQELKRISKARR